MPSSWSATANGSRSACDFRGAAHRRRLQQDRERLHSRCAQRQRGSAQCHPRQAERRRASGPAKIAVAPRSSSCTRGRSRVRNARHEPADFSELTLPKDSGGETNEKDLKDLVALGKETFESVGCTACHLVEPSETAVSTGPNLFGLFRADPRTREVVEGERGTSLPDQGGPRISAPARCARPPSSSPLPRAARRSGQALSTGDAGVRDRGPERRADRCDRRLSRHAQ